MPLSHPAPPQAKHEWQMRIGRTARSAGAGRKTRTIRSRSEHRPCGLRLVEGRPWGARRPDGGLPGRQRASVRKATAGRIGDQSMSVWKVGLRIGRVHIHQRQQAGGEKVLVAVVDEDLGFREPAAEDRLPTISLRFAVRGLPRADHDRPSLHVRQRREITSWRCHAERSPRDIQRPRTGGLLRRGEPGAALELESHA
jgi:hypothetical protein